MDVWIDENPLWGAQRPGSETVVGENKPLKKIFCFNWFIYYGEVRTLRVDDIVISPCATTKKFPRVLRGCFFAKNINIVL